MPIDDWRTWDFDMEMKIVGKVFGCLRIDSFIENKGFGNIWYSCTCIRCHTGNLKLSLPMINEGFTKACKCKTALNHTQIKPGHIFGKLKVMKLAGNDDDGSPLYLVKCMSCDTDINTPLRKEQVMNGEIRKLCNCKRINGYTGFDDMTGTMVGYLKVVSYHSTSKYNVTSWRCLCTKCNKNYVILDKQQIRDRKQENCMMCPECASKLDQGIQYKVIKRPITFDNASTDTT